MSQSMSSSTRYGEALKGKINADRLMSTTLSFSRGYLSASLSMSFALMARKRSAFSTATSGAISFAEYSPSVVTAMGSIVSSVSALENTFSDGRALGVNWSALTDANRPSTRMALGMVRRRSGIATSGDARTCVFTASTACLSRMCGCAPGRRAHGSASDGRGGGQPYTRAVQPLRRSAQSTGRPATPATARAAAPTRRTRLRGVISPADSSGRTAHDDWSKPGPGELRSSLVLQTRLLHPDARCCSVICQPGHEAQTWC